MEKWRNGRLPWRFAVAAVTVLAVATPVSAQIRYGADWSLVTRYEWRGITRGSGMSLQPNWFVSAGGDVRASLGLWTNVQMADLHPQRGMGFRRQWFSEVSPWIELSWGRPSIDVAVGWTGTFFERDGARTPEPELLDTHEVYGRLRLTSLGILLPSVTYYHDIGKVDGGFLVPGLTVRLPFWPHAVIPIGSLYLSAHAGIDLGQSTEDGSSGHFAEDGLVYWDIGLTIPVGAVASVGPIPILGLLELSPILEGHMQLNRDAVGRVKVNMGHEDGVTFWFRFGISIAGPGCDPRARVCDG